VQNVHDGRDPIAGILEQLRGAGDPGKIDDPLQVGGAAGAELTRQMLPADGQVPRQRESPHGALHLPHQELPGPLLQRLRQPQHSRAFSERPPACGRERAAHDQVADDGIVDPLDRKLSDLLPLTVYQQVRVVWPKRSVPENRNSGEVASETGDCLHHCGMGGYDDGIDQP